MKIYKVWVLGRVTLCRALAAFLVPMVLIGCAETERDDGLQGWMQNERIRHKPVALTEQVVPEILPVDASATVSTKPKGVEPFSGLRLLRIESVADALAAKIPLSSAKSRRPTLPLDSSPLAGMRLVGSLHKGGQPLALLRVNGLIYPARVGDRLGQDQGRITAITLSGLVLRETALDTAGQPIERIVSLALVAEP